MLFCRLDLATRFLDFGGNEMSDAEIGQRGSHGAQLYGFGQEIYRFASLSLRIGGSGQSAVSRQLPKAIS